MIAGAPSTRAPVPREWSTRESLLRTAATTAMREIDASNVIEYLVAAGRVTDGARATATRLAGGVSNEVLLVEVGQPAGSRFVVKQARAQLRTPQEWRCTVERIWREADVLGECQKLAWPGAVPEVLFEDRENYLYAMTAAPAGSVVWRDELLAGRIDASVAEQCGRLLAAFHAGGWHDPKLATKLADREIFRELRLDPYYQTVAQACPDAAPLMERLIDDVWRHPCTLVHADFSPKNLLVHNGQIMLVDFETGHYGDPAFDLGFFLAHLTLKTIYHGRRPQSMLELIDRFWRAYSLPMTQKIGDQAYQALVARGLANLGGCLWARIDGKSQVDYLSKDQRNHARQLARTILGTAPSAWSDVGKMLLG